jgi:hypothetical protein
MLGSLKPVRCSRLHAKLAGMWARTAAGDDRSLAAAKRCAAAVFPNTDRTKVETRYANETRACPDQLKSTSRSNSKHPAFTVAEPTELCKKPESLLVAAGRAFPSLTLIAEEGIQKTIDRKDRGEDGQLRALPKVWPAE